MMSTYQPQPSAQMGQQQQQAPFPFAYQQRQQTITNNSDRQIQINNYYNYYGYPLPNPTSQPVYGNQNNPVQPVSQLGPFDLPFGFQPQDTTITNNTKYQLQINNYYGMPNALSNQASQPGYGIPTNPVQPVQFPFSFGIPPQSTITNNCSYQRQENNYGMPNPLFNQTSQPVYSIQNSPMYPLSPSVSDNQQQTSGQFNQNNRQQQMLNLC